ncbi:MAG: helix-turn-helix transcriptional regulator [Oscillospiraceae bacterium]|nr:helix-turn-helix transcriptional regulator [Oscillospiraceae bacterium]
MTLVQKIQHLCTERGTTIAALERQAGLSRGSVRLWDKNAPSIDKVARVAKFFGVSVDYLSGVETSSDIKAQNNTERKLLILARRAVEIPQQQREQLIEYFEKTIDIYLEAKELGQNDKA